MHWQTEMYRTCSRMQAECETDLSLSYMNIWCLKHEQKLLREEMCLKHVPYNDTDHSSCGKDYWWRLYQVNKYLQIWFLLQDKKSPVSNIFLLISNRAR